VVGGETSRIRSELVKYIFPTEFIQNVLLLLKEEKTTIKITTLVLNVTVVFAEIVQVTVTIMAMVMTIITKKQ
jgi:hypothetical protein